MERGEGNIRRERREQAMLKLRIGTDWRHRSLKVINQPRGREASHRIRRDRIRAGRRYSETYYGPNAEYVFVRTAARDMAQSCRSRHYVAVNLLQ